MLEIVRAAFAARPPVDPPADALAETVESLAAALRHGGLVASTDGRDVGALVLDPEGSTLWLRRVGVLPEVREHGVATALVNQALADAEGYDDVAVLAREELPGTVAFWREHGFAETGRHSPYVELRRAAPAGFDTPDAESMRALGAVAGVRAAGRRRRGALGRAGRRQDHADAGTRRRAGGPRRRDLADVRDRPRAPAPGRRSGPGARRRLSHRRGRRARRPRPRHLPRRRGHGGRVGGGRRRGPGRRPARGTDRARGRRRRADAELDPRRVRVSPVGGRWLGVRLSSLTH